jgi:hypothetical protein
MHRNQNANQFLQGGDMPDIGCCSRLRRLPQAALSVMSGAIAAAPQDFDSPCTAAHDRLSFCKACTVRFLLTRIFRTITADRMSPEQ